VAGCCECGDEPSGSGTTELVRFIKAEDGDDMFLRNGGIYLQVYMALQPRIQTSTTGRVMVQEVTSQQASHRGGPVSRLSLHVGFVVDKVALAKVFLRVLRFSPVSIIPPWLSMSIHHLEDEQ
jgi:hypothetical protein